MLWKFACLILIATARTSYTPSDYPDCDLVEVGDERRYLKLKCGEKYKCPRSDTLYSVNSYTYNSTVWKSTNCTNQYDTVCPRDLMFYQACGHLSSGCQTVYNTDGALDVSFCKDYLCQYRNQSYNDVTETINFGTKILSGGLNAKFARCDGEISCSNTQVDETGCPDQEEAYVCKGEVDTYIPRNKVCDLMCDCNRCNDEAVCNNHTYGTNCKSEMGLHVHAMYVCNNYVICDKGEDEAACLSEDIIRYCVPGFFHGPQHYNFFPDNIRPLFPQQICATPRLGPYAWTCQDGLDQINCTDETRVAMKCTDARLPHYPIYIRYVSRVQPMRGRLSEPVYGGRGGLSDTQNSTL
ncbi:hypothetical protein ACHWQZ_G006870 [Mnemiopsis leidyi]